MTSHRSVLTEDQIAYSIRTAREFAAEAAEPSGTSETAETAEAAEAAGTAGTSETAETAEAAEAAGTAGTAETAEAAETAKNASAPRAAAPLQCTVCGKGYKYPRALQTHIASFGHDPLPVFNEIAQTADAGGASDRNIRAELDMVARLLDPFKASGALIEAAPLTNLNGSMSISPHMNEDLGVQLDFAKSVPSIGLPQLDGKAADFLFYESMLKRRVLVNVERQTMLRRMANRSPIEAGKCVFCHKEYKNKDLFYNHMTKCGKLKGVTCEYCDKTFKNEMAKSRHMCVCDTYRMCCTAASDTGDAPFEYMTKLKKAEDFIFYLFEKSITSPSMRGVSLLSNFTIDNYNEWMKQT
jgi:hypothetical protein